VERINPYLNNIAYYLVLVFAFVLMLSNALAATLAGVIFLIWLAQALAYRRKAWLKFPLFKPICALVGFKVIVLVVMGYYGSFGKIAGQLAFPLIYFTLPAIVVTAERRRRVIWMMITGAILAAGIGIIKYILGIEPRISSIVAGPYTLASYLAIVTGIMLAMVIYSKSLKEFFFWCLVSLPIFIGVILTYVRSAYMAVAASVLSIVFLKQRKYLILIAVIIAGLVFASPAIYHRILNRFDFNANYAFSDRDVLLKKAIAQSQKLEFFGNGINSFKTLVDVKNDPDIKSKTIANWHSMYFEPLLDGGPLLLLAILAVLFSQARFSMALFRKSRDPEQKIFQLGILFVILSVFIMGFFADIFKDPIITMQCWLLFGLSLI
jgi:hypothetical protein